MAVSPSPHASPFPLSSLDENANLGTVMRYEEIGKWPEKRGHAGAELGGGRGLETLCCARNSAGSQNTGSRLEQILRYLHQASSWEVGLAGLAVIPLEPRLSHPRHVEVKLLPQPKTFLWPKTLCEAEKLPRLPYLLPYFWAGGQGGEEAESHLHNLPQPAAVGWAEAKASRDCGRRWTDRGSTHQSWDGKELTHLWK